MIDTTLRDLERQHAADPRDVELLHALERTRIRAGLGWFGETLPAGVRTTECHVYERGCGPVANEYVPLVYVPGGEEPCETCDGSGRVTDTTYGREFCVAFGCVAGRRTVAPFLIGRFPVTFAEWWAFRDREKPVSGPLLMQSHPVVNVTHGDALAFCEWAGLRLPTAAEWRRAALGGPLGCPACRGSGCRGQNTAAEPCACVAMHGRHHVERRYPWGNDEPTHRTCAAQRTDEATSPVQYNQVEGAPCSNYDIRGSLRTGRIECEGTWRRTKPDSGRGLLRCDRCGTIAGREWLVPARPAGASWCGMQDAVGNVYERISDGTVRGGSFRTGPWGGSSSFVERVHPDTRNEGRDDVGFRVALDAAKEGA